MFWIGNTFRLTFLGVKENFKNLVLESGFHSLYLEIYYQKVMLKQQKFLEKY